MSQSSSALDHAFYPRSIALVGASPDSSKWGHFYLKLLLDFGFRGKLYPVNPKFSEILELEAYPSIQEIPDSVDSVMSFLPAEHTSQLMRDCVSKGVKVVTLFPARFSETGTEQGIQLEEEVVRIARQGGLRIIGPNCAGIYHPRWGLSFKFSFPKEAGAVGCLCQSGGVAAELVYRGGNRGLRFSKLVQYGNGCDLNESDFLEYFAHDPETQIIAAYIEGIKDGPRFFTALKEAAGAKPTVIFKGGRTDAGAKAAASHTGSLSGSDAVWEAVIRQTGAISVYSVDELVDLLLAFSSMPRPEGRSVGIIGGGGGGSVAAADECQNAGLVVTPFSPEIEQGLKKILPESWALIHNPVDSSVVGGADSDPAVLGDILRLMASDPEFNILTVDVAEDWVLDSPPPVGPEYFHQVIEGVIGISKECRKPMALILRPGDASQAWRWQFILEEQERCFKAGLAVYPTIARAINAIGKFVRYHEDRCE